MSKENQKLFLRPRDRSLKAYKDWILALMVHLIGETRDNITEEEWKAGWQKFWAAADKQTGEE